MCTYVERFRGKPSCNQIGNRLPHWFDSTLGSAALGDGYLRIKRSASSRLLAPVIVRKAMLLTHPDPAVGVSIAAVLPPLADAHAVEFALPFTSPVDTIRIVPTGNDVIVPVRVFGRENREQSWTLLGDGNAVHVDTDIGPDRAIALSGGAQRTVRIEADRQSAGFTSPPSIRLEFAPRAILFLAAGRPPFSRATGRATATGAYLPLDNVMTLAPGGSVPSATATTANSVLRLEPVSNAGASRRRMLLWIVLLSATALLAAVA